LREQVKVSELVNSFGAMKTSVRYTSGFGGT